MGREDEGDTLGKLFARYHPWSYGVKTIVGAAVVASLGGLIAANHEDIARKLTDTEGHSTPHLLVGCVLLGAGALLGLLGLLRMGQSFEIHRKGVRYRSWFGAREITWRDIDEIFVNKHTRVSSGGGRRSYYTIRISSVDECIRLGGGFLRSVSALGIIQLLKLHHREVGGDCDDIRVPESLARKYGSAADDPDIEGDTQAPLKKKARRRAREDEPSSGETLYDKAARQLADGVAAADVEKWLKTQGIPAPAAAAMVDKALAMTVRRQGIRMENQAEQSRDDLKSKAREQLDQGVKPEKVERWLREQGVNDNWAAAIMQDLREERL